MRAMWVRSERRVDAEMKIGGVVTVVESVLPWSDAMDEILQSSNLPVRLTLRSMRVPSKQEKIGRVWKKTKKNYEVTS